MSFQHRFDNPVPAPRLDHAPIVLRFAQLFPRDLKRCEMHRKRAGGDLSHIRHELTGLNHRWVGEEGWIDDFRQTVERVARENLRNEIAAREGKKRWSEVKRVKERGLVDPWKFTKKGPLREGILTVHKDWFGGTGIEEWDPERVSHFMDRVLVFLHEHFPDGQLLEVDSHVDEEAFHVHFVIATWTEKVSQNRGRQVLLQPSANPLIESYEHAQDVAGEALLDLGIHRGERRAAAAREALAAGLEAPEPRKHVTPSKWRAEQRRKALADRDRIREKTRVEAAQVRADAEVTAKAAQARAGVIVADATALATVTVRKSRKRAIKEAKARRAEADRAAAMAERKRADAEKRAEAARRAQAGAEAARVEEECQAAEATRMAEAQEARAAEVSGRVEVVRDGLVALNEGLKARTLREGDPDDWARIIEPARPAYPEIAPAMDAAKTFIETMESIRQDARAAADTVLAQKTEAMAEIEQERMAARADLAKQRAELEQEQAALEERQTALTLKWDAADRLLQLLQPLLEKMTSWLRRAGLPSELADEGKDILRETREVISTSKPGGEGPGT